MQLTVPRGVFLCLLHTVSRQIFFYLLLAVLKRVFVCLQLTVCKRVLVSESACNWQYQDDIYFACNWPFQGDSSYGRNWSLQVDSLFACNYVPRRFFFYLQLTFLKASLFLPATDFSNVSLLLIQLTAQGEPSFACYWLFLGKVFFFACNWSF